MKRKKSSDPPTSSPAAEADARDMLLAGGIVPKPGMSAMEQLLANIGSIETAVLTIEEFCEFVKIGRPTYYRMQRAHAGPRLTLICGQPRIKKDDAIAWVASQPVIEPDEPVPDEPRPFPAPAACGQDREEEDSSWRQGQRAAHVRAAAAQARPTAAPPRHDRVGRHGRMMCRCAEERLSVTACT